MFVGSWLSGSVVDHYTLAVAQGAVTYDWKSIWLFSTVISALVLVFFLFAFSEKQIQNRPSALDETQLDNALPQ
jgi:uncharacterized radical SAM superfamily protein